ncbi:uncharacterized protein [Cicer arietinum]|uniref:Uncharacterized protein LOC101514100 isoform X2 n=1 Tax=Cicer arietinum TaxID=3827 RepID=A0A1S2YZR7_CICAR|nr:uncharacterized protein LOC101514100 isoform X2 [Cicer arietinum]
MGKDGYLWDDSALINAFDNALSTYKKMHSPSKNNDTSIQESEQVIQENYSNAEIANTTRDVEEKSNVHATDSIETSYVSNLEENYQPCLDSKNGQGFDDYNQLIAQYYELEEKRLKILDQINQYGDLNHQYAATASNSGVQYSNAQDYSMYTPQVEVSDPNVVCSCCPCFSQCALDACASVPGCSVGGPCAGKPCNDYTAEKGSKMLIPCEDGKIHEMAMGAVERALSTIRTTISGDFDVNEEKEKKNYEQVSDSGTDLNAVLTAWYSAGFFTGKYLVEQSIENRRQK